LRKLICGIGGIGGAPYNPAMKTTVTGEEVARVHEIAAEVGRIVHAITGDASFKASLFGSWASGTARSHSDIDIAIDGPRPVEPVKMAAIREACDRLPTLFTIDLVDLGKASSDFRDAVRGQMRPVDL
jgi:predicted nucleotidyltransferase